jgi:hypothetical protein
MAADLSASKSLQLRRCTAARGTLQTCYAYDRQPIEELFAMKTSIAIFLLTLPVMSLTGCSPSTQRLEPLPNSPVQADRSPRLAKAPIGSTVNYQVYGPFGDRFEETYQVQPDRSLRLVRRYELSIPGE